MTPSPVTQRAARILAPNPGPLTLDGTNTWVLREPGASGCVVVDPGPLDEAHLRAVAACGPVELVLLTHAHPDHAEGAARLAELTGAPVRALDPAHARGLGPLTDGEVLEVAGLQVRVVATPGHSADSLTFVLPADGAVLTGDTVLGRGSTVVAHPDGRLVDYLASLRQLRALADAGIGTLLPGHGPPVEGLGALVDDYLAHRAERLAQVRDAVAIGVRTAQAIVEVVYAEVDRALWPAAELSVRAQLAYLEEIGG